jgi:TRAP-type C4-dicarboxylate transport system permease small subunit
LSAFEASSDRQAALPAAVSVSRLLLALERRTTALSLWGACAALVVAAVIGFYQIVSRFILLQPAEWSEVSVRIALIWMVFLAIPTAFRQGAMVCVDLLYRWSGPRLRRGLDTVAALVGMVLIAVMIWFGTEYAWRTRFQTIPGIESLTVVWAYAAMPVGGVFSVLAILAQWFDPRRNELETAQ